MAHVRNRRNCPWQSLNKLLVLQMLLGVEKRSSVCLHLPPASNLTLVSLRFINKPFSSSLSFFFSFYNLNLHSDTPTHLSYPYYRCSDSESVFPSSSYSHLHPARFFIYPPLAFSFIIENSWASYKVLFFPIKISDFIFCLTLSLVWRTSSKYEAVSLLFIEPNVSMIFQFQVLRQCFSFGNSANRSS